MRTKRLGRDGPGISVIGFGAWEAGKSAEWGEPPPDDQIRAAIASVFDTGIDWIDTAEVYGDGTSERFVGEVIAGRRDQVAIATKVGPKPEGSGFRPEQVAKACRASLERLGTDHVDVYQLHWPDPTGVPIEETWGAMARLVEEGLVRAIGVSNFDRDLIERCMAVRHVDSLQQEFSMLTRADRELIRWCGEQGIGVLSYGPLAYGLLAGAISMETTFARGDHRGYGESWSALFEPEQRRRALAVVDDLRPIAERLGCSLPQLALAWNVHQPGVTAAIAGSRDAAHVRTNAEAGDVALDEATLAEIEALLALGPV
ncbi:MAG TPA: aldo/keto reductase [Actinomycetota bacterium]|nr:aldo/keto reductase [Actinomycetota bacterium]